MGARFYVDIRRSRSFLFHPNATFLVPDQKGDNLRWRIRSSHHSYRDNNKGKWREPRTSFEKVRWDLFANALISELSWMRDNKGLSSRYTILRIPTIIWIIKPNQRRIHKLENLKQCHCVQQWPWNSVTRHFWQRVACNFNLKNNCYL